MKEKDNILVLARDFIKTARDHAEYKRIEGYDESRYDLFQIINFNAAYTICDRGPADYFYEKAYDMLCAHLGKDHPETRQLVSEIISYHVHNIQRMMQEIFTIVVCILLIFLVMDLPYLFRPSQCPFAFAACNASIAFFWYLEQVLMCFMERRHYQRVYNNKTG